LTSLSIIINLLRFGLETANNFLEPFSQQYDSHLKHLKLKGLQPK
jgi:hypothetical protein